MHERERLKDSDRKSEKKRKRSVVSRGCDIICMVLRDRTVTAVKYKKFGHMEIKIIETQVDSVTICIHFVLLRYANECSSFAETSTAFLTTVSVLLADVISKRNGVGSLTITVSTQQP